MSTADVAVIEQYEHILYLVNPGRLTASLHSSKLKHSLLTLLTSLHSGCRARNSALTINIVVSVLLCTLQIFVVDEFCDIK
jgi:hypothetical protein